MIKPSIEPIKTIHGKLERKCENFGSLDLIESTEYMKKFSHESEVLIGCPKKRISCTENLKYYFKNKLDDLKLQTVYYKSHFKKSCFKCPSSFHGSRLKDGHFNLQKMLDFGNKCDICIKYYTKERSFLHNCNVCNASFRNCKFLKHHHSREHNSEMPHQCAACHQQLSDGGFVTHINKHIPQLICPYCKKRFARKSNLEAHMLSHFGVTPFSCDYCPKQYTKKYNLNIHLLGEHTGGKQFKCDSCSKTFASQIKLSQHKPTHMEKSFHCHYCPKQYKTKQFLDVHLFEHTGGKPFKCDLCDKTFAKQFKLNQHKLTHMEKPIVMEKLFQCIYCPKQYTTKKDLDVHRFEHTRTGGKEFECDLCYKTFGKQYKLNRHRSSHVDRFQCIYCPKQYTTKKYLNVHLFEHTGGKQFKCDLCDKTFAKQYKLNQHKINHMEKSFQCTICTKFYKTYNVLRRHIMSVHKL